MARTTAEVTVNVAGLPEVKSKIEQLTAERDALQARIDRVRPWLSTDLAEILDGEYDGRPHTLDHGP